MHRAIDKSLKTMCLHQIVFTYCDVISQNCNIVKVMGLEPAYLLKQVWNERY